MATTVSLWMLETTTESDGGLCWTGEYVPYLGLWLLFNFSWMLLCEDARLALPDKPLFPGKAEIWDIYVKVPNL